jgi:hypothetical protein
VKREDVASFVKIRKKQCDHLVCYQTCGTYSVQIKPPFTEQTALAKVKAAEDAWNSRDPERVALAYTEDSEWRNRAEFFKGRKAIKEFLTRKWQKELDYKLMKELWCYQGNRISVRFEYEYRDANNPKQWTLGIFRGRIDEKKGYEC